MSDIELVSYHNPAEKQHKKKKRHRDDDEKERVDDEGKAESKKRKKHREEPRDNVPSVVAEMTTGAQESTLAKEKKKKKKEKKRTRQRPAGYGLFPLPNSVAYPPYFTGAEPSASLFPTLNDLPFPDLTFGSNEDVLRALQDLDMSKIAGVLKTLTETADAANIPIPMTAIPSTSRQPLPVASTSVSAGGTKPNKKHRRTLDITSPSSSSEPSSHSSHAHLLANKWLGPAKLAELVASEGAHILLLARNLVNISSGLVYKKGKFSAIEIKQINEAIEHYRTTRGLSEDDVNALIFPSDDKKKDAEFWTALTKAVPQRPIVAVYHYVRRARHPMKQQGKWQPDEDTRLIQAVTSIVVTGTVITSLIKKNELLELGVSLKKKSLHGSSLKCKKGKNLDNDIFWGKAAEMMGGTRSRQQCRIKWTDSLAKKYKTDGKNPRWSQRDAFILIQKVDALNVRDDTEINWKTIPDSEWNLWSAHTLQRRWLTMKKGIKGFEAMAHREIMDILRVKNAEIPQGKIIKSSKFVVDSDDEEPRPGSSTGPGTLAGKAKGNEDEDDSE
ncbi:Nucleolar protein [Mycena venus]|uniref:Nucleolar protein n=1 Tax=Mycena venus TaxID=2733690 RepID=A0A8H7CZ07_9AGAR|nr:Nucleolar protein [Mycena venus]